MQGNGNWGWSGWYCSHLLKRLFQRKMQDNVTEVHRAFVFADGVLVGNRKYQIIYLIAPGK
jgi:hypothetical protein